jgi:hypothetical protein
MSLILMLSVQAAVAVPAAPVPSPAAAPRWAMPAMAGADGSPTGLAFDLAHFRSEAGGACAGGAADILVCGRRRARAVDRAMMDYWDRIYAPRPIRAEMDLGGGARGDVHVEQQEYSNGTVAKRVMVGIRLPS